MFVFLLYLVACLVEGWAAFISPTGHLGKLEILLSPLGLALYFLALLIAGAPAPTWVPWWRRQRQNRA